MGHKEYKLHLCCFCILYRECFFQQSSRVRTTSQSTVRTGSQRREFSYFLIEKSVL